jgi:hypothetical protein
VSCRPVSTRPDLSNASADGAGEPTLLVEVKLVRARGDVRRSTDEILADIPKCTDRGRSALFLVHDAGGYISDGEAFAALFSGRVAVRVLR